MNIIIAKLGLPCDINNKIIKYCCNSEGYTINDLDAIKKEKNKKRNKFVKLRQKLELTYWWASGSLIHALCTRLHKEHIYAGDTFEESSHLRVYYNRKLQGKYHDLIEEWLEEGDLRREYGSLGYNLNPWPGTGWDPVTRRYI